MFRPKAAEIDYEQYMLPKNRKEVFFDVIKLNWLRFLLYGCLVLVISMPVHVSALLGELYRTRLASALETGKIGAEQARALAASSGTTGALVDIVLFIISAIGFSGFAHIMRQHAWEENVYFRYEYIKGIRQNAGSFALLGLLTGLIRFACVWFRSMLLINGGDAYYYAGYMPSVWAGILLIPAAAYLTVCIPIYGVRFHVNVKSAFLLYFKNFIKTWSALLICGAVFLLQMIPGFFSHLFGRLISSLFLPFITLGWFLFTYDRLDADMNRKWYPQLVGRGIFNGEKK